MISPAGFWLDIDWTNEAEKDGEHDEAVVESEQGNHEEYFEKWGKYVRSGSDKKGESKHSWAATWKIEFRNFLYVRKLISIPTIYNSRGDVFHYEENPFSWNWLII